jgi:hypothetical protein
MNPVLLAHWMPATGVRKYAVLRTTMRGDERKAALGRRLKRIPDGEPGQPGLAVSHF